MSLELGPKGIRVNCINPTMVETDMTKAVWSNPDLAAARVKNIPMGRFAVVDDVVNAVLFLLGDNASLINGIAMFVDGGASHS